MTKQEYSEQFTGGHARRGQQVNVPDDIVRLHAHEPCFYCGTARGMCRHRTIIQ